MKRLKTILILLLVFAMLSCCLTGCGERSGINKLIRSFEKSCTRLDASGMMDCLNPRSIGQLRTTLALLGITDIDEILLELLDAFGLMDDVGKDAVDFFRSIEIDPHDYDFNSDKSECVVTSMIEYSINGQKIKMEAYILCVNLGSHWYIEDIY